MINDEVYDYEVIVQARVFVTLSATHPCFAESAAIRTALEISKTIAEAYPDAKCLPYKIIPMKPYDTSRTLELE